MISLTGPGLGLGIMLHVEPSQYSISVCVLPLLLVKLPTAQMLFADEAATLKRVAAPAPGLGLDTTAHIDPFQCSMSGSVLPLPLGMYWPTAQTLLAEMAVTPVSPFSLELGLGLEAIVHFVPFQWSMSVSSA